MVRKKIQRGFVARQAALESGEKNHLKMSNITHKWVSLLSPYAAEYAAKYSASSLARLLGIPQQTASRYLNELVANNQLSFVQEGRNKLFYFNFKQPSTRIMLEMIEQERALKFQRKNNAAVIAVNDLAAVADSLIIFGSHAAGTAREDSDLDIVVFSRKSKEQIQKIKQRYSFEINEHYSSYAEFGTLLQSQNPLALEILKNHLLFGNVSKLVALFMEDAHGYR